jgi:hypothetical protein
LEYVRILCSDNYQLLLAKLFFYFVLARTEKGKTLCRLRLSSNERGDGRTGEAETFISISYDASGWRWRKNEKSINLLCVKVFLFAYYVCTAISSIRFMLNIQREESEAEEKGKGVGGTLRIIGSDLIDFINFNVIKARLSLAFTAAEKAQKRQSQRAVHARKQ